MTKSVQQLAVEIFDDESRGMHASIWIQLSVRRLLLLRG